MNNSRGLSPLQVNSTEESPLELGYGPDSLSSISYEIPIYTINDQMWIGSNYNLTIQAQLLGSQGQTLASQEIGAGTILRLYSFTSSFLSPNLTLDISSSSSCSQNCFSFSTTIEFVNTSSTYISGLDSQYSINAATLSSSYSIQPSNGNLMPNLEECLTNSSSASQAEIQIPSSLGTGSLGIIGDPSSASAQLLFGNASVSNTFLFSFALYTNYTYALAQSSGIGYRTSEVQVAAFPSIVIGPSNGSSAPQRFPLTELAAFRSGRYLIRAIFQNGGGVTVLDTPVVLGSGTGSSWFWLGACQELSTGSGYSVSSQSDLSGSPGDWPRYLYLMYQIYPGIDSFANFSLNLPISRVKFSVAGSGDELPSDIKLSTVTSTNIQELDLESSGNVYMISSHYPSAIRFSLSFAGKSFATQTVNISSAYSHQSETVELGQLSATAEQNGKGIPGATIIIYSDSLNTSLNTATDTSGNVVVSAPPGNYTITIQTGDHVMKSAEIYLAAQKIQTYVAVFPTQTADYNIELIWIVAIVAIIGAIGNLWFWIVKRKDRSFQPQN
jgi:hypothetical protein